ncbi:30S ribosomal protein S12 methylthiotransferase RimO [Treponema sp. OttesenSCG-928-L16]|nr:30S ribosomal protein S12 methylthiotransferase RimO [Treponema sp. OttesenSCG-928-L16]
MKTAASDWSWPGSIKTVLYFIDPYGCVKNQVDAETMMSVLNEAGWKAAENPEEADLIIVNSCGFIESAKRESIEAVLGFRKAYPQKKILLAGCLAQRYAEELSLELTEADFFFGNTDLSRAAEAARAALDSGRGTRENKLLPPLDETGALDFAPYTGTRPLLSLPGSAYVKITEGCDNRCSFCAIPLIRGPLRSRRPEEILEECRELIGRGIRELCVIGQDLGSYGKDGAQGSWEKGSCRLPELLDILTELEGSFWLRLLYIHPDNFPEPLLDLCRGDSRFLPYFDLPFQHASPSLLRAMKRRGDGGSYLRLIRGIRSALPGALIRSTFMTGFPGETDEDFECLLDFQEQARLDWLGVFAYSREEGTPAYSLGKKVPRRLAEERKALLEERQIPISEERMDRFVGTVSQILIEERVENEDGLYLGRLPCQAPEVDGAAVISSDVPLQIGTFVKGRIISRSGIDLFAAALDG